MRILNGLLIILIFLLIGCSERQAGDEQVKATNLKEAEPNNSQSEAQPVADGTALRGFIDEPMDQDWYRITVPADTMVILKAQLTGVPELNLKMELFDQAGDELIEVDRNKEGEGEVFTNYGLLTGDYYLRIRELWLKNKTKKANDSTHYVLKIDLQPATEDLEFEPNNRGVEATPLVAGTEVAGFISPYHDEDWYKLPLPREARYYMAIHLSGVEGIDTKIGIYDPIEALILEKDSEPKGEPEIIPNLGVDTTNAFYYIVVKGGQWQTNEDQTYRLRVDFIDAAGYVEIEPNDRMVRATPLVENDTLLGFLETAKDEDWYSWKNTDSAATVLRLEAHGVKKVDLVITVFNQDEEEVFKINDAGEMEPEFFPNLGLLPNKVYYFNIQNNIKKGNAEEFYSLVTQMSRYYNDEEFEANNTPEKASLILSNRPVAGYIHPGGDVDYYRLDLKGQPQNKLEIKLRGILKVNTNLVLYDNALNELATAAERPAEETERISLTVEDGIYYIKVFGQNATQCNYRDKYQLLATVRPIF